MVHNLNITILTVFTGLTFGLLYSFMGILAIIPTILIIMAGIFIYILYRNATCPIDRKDK